MDNVNAYVDATKDVQLEALTRSVDQFSSGRVERNNAFPPSAGELAENCRQWKAALDSRGAPAQELHNGLIESDWGHGRVDLRGLTNAEQDIIIAGKGFVNGKNLAYMPTEEIRAELTQGDLAGIEGGRSFTVPKLGRMS